jgi:hypothetical protein
VQASVIYLLVLNVLLQSELKNTDVLCVTKHWLKEEQIGLTNIYHFKLVSTFSRISNENGGSCVHVYSYVKEYVQTKEQNCLQKFCKEDRL